MKATWSLFPKAYREFNATQLAQLVHQAGLDSTNVVIRKGYPVEEDVLESTLPAFLQDARKEGIEITCASTTYTADEISGPNSPLAVLAANGIREFRMGWFPKADDEIPAVIHQAKADMDRVAEACQKHRIRAIYQLHHNTLITSPSAAFSLVKGLPSQWIGVELDPGNQSYQGFEPWPFSVGLLGDFCAWVGVKDTITWQEKSLIRDPDKGWRRSFAPISEGVTNWRRLIESLVATNFDGTFVFMPFYDEKDEAARTKKLCAEVKYLKAICSVVQAE